MKIPKVCDICGAPTTEGDYWESWWLCTNKKCRKSDPEWSFKEAFEPYREKFNKLDDIINKLSKIQIGNYDIEIKLHEARWIGEGSGDIKVRNNGSNFLVRFYFYKGNVEYITDNEMLLETLTQINFGSRLKEMWKILRKRNDIFTSKSTERKIHHDS